MKETHKLSIILSLLLTLFLCADVYAEPVVIEKAFSVICNTTGQVCEPPGTVTLNLAMSSTVSMAFRTFSSHCSSIRVDIFGSLNGSTGFLTANQQTSVLDERYLESGNYIFSIYATGEAGECNKGNLKTWGGNLIFYIEGDNRKVNLGEADCEG